MVFDSAVYADVIHDGRGSSAKAGRRPFLQDPLEAFVRGGVIADTLEAAIQNELEA
jgi:hypothetical protein